MDNELKKKYGLPTAIALVIGIVIGSGVFFKAEKILTATGGNLPLGILAWAIGGLIMIICAYMFSILATRYAHVNGLVDYAEALVGKRYAYYMGWFTTFIYFPAMASVLAWVSARYLGVLCGFDITGGPVMVLACLFLVGSYAVNALSPILAGKFQVATTVIKLIPLLLMGIVGTIVGLANGTTIENFTTVVTTVEGGNGHALFTAVAATAFAYEGWIIATSINAELKNARRNLPIALVIGTLIVALTYILYYIGLSGSVSNAEIMAGGEAGAKLAFEKIFGRAAGVGLFVLVVVSCLGTLNGLMLAATRSLYSVAARGNGPKPEAFLGIDAILNIMINITDGLVVYPKVIEQRVMRELPFMATENIMMRAVEKGGNRQELHEALRGHSMAAADVVKKEGGENDLVKRIAADPIFQITEEEIRSVLKPENYTGRAPEQVEEFLRGFVRPVLEKNKELLGEHVELSV